MSTLIDLLSGHIQDPLFMEWIKQSRPATIQELWTTCPRGSWLLQIVGSCHYGQDEIERKVLVQVAFECASLSLTTHQDTPAAREMTDALKAYCRVQSLAPWDQNRPKLLDESNDALQSAKRKLGTGPWLSVIEAVEEAANAASTAAMQPQGRLIGFTTAHWCWRASDRTESIGVGMAAQTAEIVRVRIQFDSLRSLSSDGGK